MDTNTYSKKLSGKIANAIIREVYRDIPHESQNLVIKEVTKKLIGRLKFLKQLKTCIGDK